MACVSVLGDGWVLEGGKDEVQGRGGVGAGRGRGRELGRGMYPGRRSREG